VLIKPNPSRYELCKYLSKGVNLGTTVRLGFERIAPFLVHGAGTAFANGTIHISGRHNVLFIGHALDEFIWHSRTSKEPVGDDLVLFSKVDPLDGYNELISLEYRDKLVIQLQELQYCSG
jgi:hypothetical protein